MHKNTNHPVFSNFDEPDLTKHTLLLVFNFSHLYPSCSEVVTVDG